MRVFRKQFSLPQWGIMVKSLYILSSLNLICRILLNMLLLYNIIKNSKSQNFIGYFYQRIWPLLDLKSWNQNSKGKGHDVITLHMMFRVKNQKKLNLSYLNFEFIFVFQTKCAFPLFFSTWEILCSFTLLIN